MWHSAADRDRSPLQQTAFCVAGPLHSLRMCVSAALFIQHALHIHHTAAFGLSWLFFHIIS